jgi:hypothetical protein
MATDAVGEFETATDAEWRFHTEEFARLSDNDTRRLSELLDRATHRMVEGPYDRTVIPGWTSSRVGRSEAIPSLRFAGERETRPVAFGPGIRSSATAASGLDRQRRIRLPPPGLNWRSTVRTRDPPGRAGRCRGRFHQKRVQPDN